MNNTSTSDSNGGRQIFLNFNQDNTSLSLACKAGYKLFSLSNSDKIEAIYSNATEDSCIVERLFNSSLVAVVSLAAPRKLKVCHFKKGTEICNYSYSNTILAVKLNRTRLIVCLEESLYLHNIRDMKVLHTIRDTPPNPSGLCCLSPNSENCYLAYPGSPTVGEVQIFDAMNLQAKIMIHAHESPLASIAFSPNGLRIGTASEKGTVIRVFSVTDGTKLYEFRRGMKRCVTISSLAFSLNGQFLASTSNTETIHIFKLDELKESPTEESWMGYLSSYLPTQVTDVFTQGRAFAAAYLPSCSGRNVIALAKIQEQMRLLVGTQDGVLYIYNFNTADGGDLELYKTHVLNTDIPKEKDKGDSVPAIATESERNREMAEATELPPADVFQFQDDDEFPPLRQNSD